MLKEPEIVVNVFFFFLHVFVIFIGHVKIGLWCIFYHLSGISQNEGQGVLLFNILGKAALATREYTYEEVWPFVYECLSNF